MITKMFEVRDAGTFIPCIAVRMVPTLQHGVYDEAESYLLSRAGYQTFDRPLIMFMRADGGSCHFDYYDWGYARTMPTAHKFIEENWDALESGAVIDVEFIQGETKSSKVSEAVGYPL